MIITFPTDEVNNIRIQHLPPRTLSPDYLTLRDELWVQKQEEGNKVGKEFWNGILYSFEGIIQKDMNTPILMFSTMSYADRIAKQKIGIDTLVERFGQNHYLVHCGVGIVIKTTDGKYVLGNKMSVSLKTNRWSHVSGNMNANEVTVNTFEDIYKTALAELEEETIIPPERSILHFTHINIFNGYCNFDFTYNAPFHSTEVEQYIRTGGEFDTLQCFTKEELHALEGISDFEYSKKYIS